MLWSEVQLTDLCVALSRRPNLEVAFEPISRVRHQRNEVVISSAYGEYDPKERFLCQLADVYLRCLGNLAESDAAMGQSIRDAIASIRLANLATHVFCCIDDCRLAGRIGRERPGTRLAFRAREAFYARMLVSSRAANERRRAASDVWYALWYDAFHAPSSLLRERALACENAQDCLDQTCEVMDTLPPESESWADLAMRVFGMDDDRMAAVSVDEAGEDHSRSDARTGQAKGDADGEEGFDESVEVWTQPQASNKSFGLDMPLRDTQTNGAAGEDGRMTEMGAENVEVRRGRTDDGPNAVIEQSHDDSHFDLSRGTKDVRSRSKARVVEIGPDLTVARSSHDLEAWERFTSTTRQRLVRVFSRTFERTRMLDGGAVRHGRLGKHLERVAVAPTSRLFYRKEERGGAYDAVVHVLIDCSGSMYSYLDACKPLLYLLHETLRNLGIVHALTGFWEDTEYHGVQRGEPVTYLSHAIPFERSLSASIAAQIGALEPQLDNRDGLAIRRISECLLARLERQKWLFVVSDAQPAAEDYRDAIADTKQAIRFARRRGIHVVHLNIADTNGALDVEGIKRLYGDDTVLVSDVNALPIAFERILRDILRRIAHR